VSRKLPETALGIANLAAVFARAAKALVQIEVDHDGDGTLGEQIAVTATHALDMIDRDLQERLLEVIREAERIERARLIHAETKATLSYHEALAVIDVRMAREESTPGDGPGRSFDDG